MGMGKCWLILGIGKVWVDCGDLGKWVLIVEDGGSKGLS